MDFSDPRQREIFFAIHHGLPREGPGNRACAERALALAAPLPGPPRILDIACGPGLQTVELAEMLPGAQITAIDAFPAVSRGPEAPGRGARRCRSHRCPAGQPLRAGLRRVLLRPDLVRRRRLHDGARRSGESLAAAAHARWTDGDLRAGVPATRPAGARAAVLDPQLRGHGGHRRLQREDPRRGPGRCWARSCFRRRPGSITTTGPWSTGWRRCAASMPGTR